MPTPTPLTTIRLPGLTPFLTMWERQRMLAAARQRGEIGDLLFLLEHDHVYTNGRGGRREHLLVDEETLARLGATYHEIDRGGDITYHGPGQLVGYPILDLGGAGRRVRAYVHALETAIIDTAAHFGVPATARSGFPGAWVEDAKLAAIGIKVGRGVTSHGFALNVAPDLSYFDQIVPCAIPDCRVTSLARLLGRHVTVDEVVPICAAALADVLGMELRWNDERSDDGPPGEEDRPPPVHLRPLRGDGRARG